MDERAAAFEPSGAVAYPLVSRGERFPFLAPDATALLLGTPADDADRWAGLLQGVGFAERLCLDYLHHLGAPLDGPLTFTGGAARSPYWNQLRADILGRPARVPEQTEPALGMAALALHGTMGIPWRRPPSTWSASARSWNRAPAARPSSPTRTPVSSANSPRAAGFRRRWRPTRAPGSTGTPQHPDDDRP